MQIAKYSFYHLFKQPLRPQILQQEHQILLLQVQDSIRFSNFRLELTNNIGFSVTPGSRTTVQEPNVNTFCVMGAGTGSKTVPSTVNGTSDANSTKLTMSLLFFLLFIASQASTLGTI
jgi:hypothetical protein